MGDNWFWLSDRGRDKRLRDELANQAMAAAAARARQRRETTNLRSDLMARHSSLESRLTALTNAFLAYVELDALRDELASFAGNAEARRAALDDLDTLLTGEVPSERPDVEGYWLPPAVAALWPDGSIDAGRAALAHERDSHAATEFIVVARAMLGAGAVVAGELPGLLHTDEEGRWEQWQVLVWVSVLRGAFGPAALSQLDATLRPIIAEASDWADWCAKTAGVRGEAGMFDWMVERIDSISSADTQDQVHDWGATQTMLEDVLHIIIATRNDERDLLIRAELLEEQVSSPKTARALSERPPKPPRHDVLALVRDAALDERVRVADRRWLWELIGEQLTVHAHERLRVPAPKPPEMKVTGGNGLVAGPDGLKDPAKLRAMLRRYQESPRGVGMRLALSGAAVVLLGLMLAIIGAAAGWVLLVAGSGTVFWGVKLRQQESREQAWRANAATTLQRNADSAVAAAAREHEKNLSLHQQVRDAANRFLYAMNGLRRRPSDHSSHRFASPEGY